MPLNHRFIVFFLQWTYIQESKTFKKTWIVHNKYTRIFKYAFVLNPPKSILHPLRIFTIFHDTCSIPSWFKENTPTAFQINYWPLLSHYKQTLFRISIALCPHWLKLEAWWPHVVLASPMHQQHPPFYSITLFGARGLLPNEHTQ